MLLLLLLALVVPGQSPTQAATQRRVKRVVFKNEAAGRKREAAGHKREAAVQRVSPRRLVRRKRQTAAARALSLPEPRRAEGEEGGEDREARQSWFRLKRAYPFDDIPLDARRKAWAARPRSKGTGGQTRAAAGTQQVWTPIGPAPTVSVSPFQTDWGGTSGRINAVAVSPANAKLILVGASTGGIWRSTVGGKNFVPVSDEQVDLAVGWISFAPGNPAIVYAGMGDIDYEYLGSGVLKSTDAGATWARVSNSSLPDGATARIEVDPANSERVYLAQYMTRDRATNTSLASGFFISTDGGVNWTKTLAGQARDVVIHPTNPQTLYVTLAAQSHLSGERLASGLYRSTDGGLNWTGIAIPLTGLHGGLWDFRVAISPADPQRIYAYYGTLFFGETRLRMSADGGATWQTRSLNQVDSGQFGYCTYLFADPKDANTLYLGTRDLYKSTDGGLTWNNMTQNFHLSGEIWSYRPYLASTHADQQAFAFEPGNSSSVYLANDGGLWKSPDGGTTMQSLNTTLSLVQFNSLALHPTDAGFTIGGTQDNGTQRRLKDTTTNAPTVNWTDMSGSDGGACLFNPVNPGIFYGTYYSAWVNRYKVAANGSTSFDKQIGTFSTWGDSEINTRIAFYPPLTGNEVDQTIYFGTWRLFKSTNLGDTWTAPAPETDLTKGTRDVLSAIGVARSDTNVIYTGSRQGRAMVSTDGGVNWRDITQGLPDRFIERIVVDPSNSAHAYLVVSGYGSGHVFKTTDGGQTWADVSGNLPNIPTSALLIDPLNSQTLYAGTDIGVFRSTVGGNVWESFNEGLPPVMITAFAAQPGGRIQVATYGRGAYELTTRAAPSSTVAFSAASYEAAEGAGFANVVVTRTGDTSGASSVDVATIDDPAAVPCDPTLKKPDGAPYPQGTAYARCDYATTIETISWAAGDSLPKAVRVPLVDDVHLEGAENLQLRLANPQGATLGTQRTSALVIQDNDTSQAAANPTFSTGFFVRLHYLDFLSREPEANEPWSAVLNNCPDAFNLDARSPSAACDRLIVSQSFFGSLEFRMKGFFVYNFYRVALNRRPEYAEIIPDMRSVTGETSADTYARRAAYPSLFTQRPEFKDAYDGLSDAAFVNNLLDRYTLSHITTPDPQQPEASTRVVLTRAELIARLGASGAQVLTRAQVLRAVVESIEVGAAEYNGAFVAMQYYGYLRRTPEESGYQAWLRVINEDPNNVRIMVNGFMNSTEYRLRFGQP
ncbi:MAG TPA: Calx-beta domain-containing protein [Pyrinomonadaceae bacterium]|nr:Calx-beta domain-containing protein [Pyrinomonadaceae bacterium]